MTDVLVEIPLIKRAAQRSLPLDKGTRDALADYCRYRWPAHTAKMAARAWNLSVDEARGVVAGRTSLTTYDKIKKAGGWPVILWVEAAVVGHGIDQFLARTGASNEENGEHLAALVGDLWPGGRSRLPHPDHRADALGDRPRAERRSVG